MVGDSISPFISQQVPILWSNSKIHRLNNDHRSIFNNKKFLKLFCQIILK